MDGHGFPLATASNTHSHRALKKSPYPYPGVLTSVLVLASKVVLTSCRRIRWCSCSPAKGARHLLACSYSPGRRCSPAPGLLPGVLMGFSPSKLPCTPGAPHAGARPILLSRPRAGAQPAQCLRWGIGELHAPLPTSAQVSSSTTTSLHSSRQQGDTALKTQVASVFF